MRGRREVPRLTRELFSTANIIAILSRLRITASRTMTSVGCNRYSSLSLSNFFPSKAD
jgi:hypothetical protein